ncbi:MAG: type II secretion system minor pseudopilin GspI [Gammaproteobacteria bacterium]
MTRRASDGFTLLEVMVALAIVSIGLIAAFNAVIQMAHSTSVLRERALADWIAMNEISAIRLSGDFPEIGDFDGTTEFAGREWRWEARISATGVEDLRRIDMSVAYEDFIEDSITIMTGFVSRGGLTGPALIDWWGMAAGSPPPGADGEAEEPVEEAGAPRERRPRRSRQTEEDDDG